MLEGITKSISDLASLEKSLHIYYWCTYNPQRREIHRRQKLLSPNQFLCCN